MHRQSNVLRSTVASSLSLVEIGEKMNYGTGREFAGRRRPLAASVAALYLLSPSCVGMAATSWTVDSCSEANAGSGTTGSLRYAAANAQDGDIIDMTMLTCSTISLQTGAITLAQRNITLDGPGMDKLNITGTQQQDRIINRPGPIIPLGGILAINNLSISYGTNKTLYAAGGCIYSYNNVVLDHVSVSHCRAQTDGNGFGDGGAMGGGIFTKESLSMRFSKLDSNMAIATSPGAVAHGGGAVPSAGDSAEFPIGGFYAESSTISNNVAQAVSGSSFGGGIRLFQRASNVVISNSTFSGNVASRYGAMGIGTANAGATTTISNSTISDNHALVAVGGMYDSSGTIKLLNSTIAFNTSATNGSRAPGLEVSSILYPVAVTMQGTLIANNGFVGTTPAADIDLSASRPTNKPITFDGSGNLVRATSAAVPMGTIIGACPLLGPLRDNGGPTQTQALLSHSPAIDAGNNTTLLTYDQRGAPNVRTSGTTTDIGAYEVQQDDVVFNGGFEGC